MTAFRRKGEQFTARFRRGEVEVIRLVVTETMALVAEAPAKDPVVERLFPAIYPDSPLDQADLRRYTEDDLKKGKISAAETLLAGLAPTVTLTAEEADAWLRALNDVRLALGTRLDLRDDVDLEAELESAEPQRASQISVYGYLSYLQESLLAAFE